MTSNFSFFKPLFSDVKQTPSTETLAPSFRFSVKELVVPIFIDIPEEV